MSGDTAYTRTFSRAIETLGGVEDVAGALGASVGEVEAWTVGLADPPPGIFLRAIDIVAQPRLYSRRAARLYEALCTQRAAASVRASLPGNPTS